MPFTIGDPNIVITVLANGDGILRILVRLLTVTKHIKYLLRNTII